MPSPVSMVRTICSCRHRILRYPPRFGIDVPFFSHFGAEFFGPVDKKEESSLPSATSHERDQMSLSCDDPSNLDHYYPTPSPMTADLQKLCSEFTNLCSKSITGGRMGDDVREALP